MRNHYENEREKPYSEADQKRNQNTQREKREYLQMMVKGFYSFMYSISKGIKVA